MQNKIHIGHVLDVLKTFPDEFVDCIITSPPYWGLRDYGTEPQIWDGDDGCEHEWGDEIGGAGKGNDQTAGEKQKTSMGSIGRENRPPSQFCLRCNAWHGSLGLEPTPELYVQHIVQIFHEVRRVLKREGTLWLNLGDSYTGNVSRASSGGRAGYGTPREGVFKRGGDGLKSKDLCGIPWRVAFALQANGWYLRSDIIWHKPNPMPESVTDRPTKAHEYVFLLTKSPKYYFDQDAVKEPIQYLRRAFSKNNLEIRKDKNNPQYAVSLAQDKYYRKLRNSIEQGNPFGRNIRSVWTIASQSFSGAHFATFPEKLVEPMIKAGTSDKGCCPKCGKAWVRVVEKGNLIGRDRGGNYKGREIDRFVKKNPGTPGLAYELETIGWKPTCECGLEPIPCVVLDPFMGSGTVAKVATKLRRNWVGIDLKPEYVDMAGKRKAWTQVEMI